MQKVYVFTVMQFVFVIRVLSASGRVFNLNNISLWWEDMIVVFFESTPKSVATIVSGIGKVGLQMVPVTKIWQNNIFLFLQHAFSNML